MNKNILIGIVIVIAVFAGVGAWVKFSVPKPIACTEEAKICPDGSAVGRTGPNCEFAPCPSEEARTRAIKLFYYSP